MDDSTSSTGSTAVVRSPRTSQFTTTGGRALTEEAGFGIWTAPVPVNETERLMALRAYRILDTEHEESFDRFTKLAARFWGTKIALISLVDDNRQWFKSAVGLDAPQTGRTVSFCAHLVANPAQKVFVVSDAHHDPVFEHHPLVTGAPNIGFYAGAALVNQNGMTLGSFCIIDEEARDFNDEERDRLKDMADLVVQEMELRLRNYIMQHETIDMRSQNLVLGNENKRLLSALACFSEGLVMFDNKSRIKYVNDGWEHITGYDRNTSNNRHISLLQGAETDTKVLADLKDSLHKGAHASTEMLCYRKDGSSFWGNLRLTPSYDTQGNIFYFGVLSDNTERKQRELELERARAEAEKAKSLAEIASQAKSNFLTNMSHELRTPLHGVLGCIHVLSRSPLSADQQTWVSTIQKSCSALVHIINDILDISKITMSKITLDCQPFDLVKTLEEVIQSHAAEAAEKRLDMAVHVPENCLVPLKGDKIRLMRVITNFVSNAIKFTPSGSVILRAAVASSTESNVTMRFSVTDTGIGIRESDFALLFKRFSQVDDSSARGFGGTGLGLALSKELAELMGGQIGVESVWGEGSTFWFTAVLQRDSLQAGRLDQSLSLSTSDARRASVGINPAGGRRAVVAHRQAAITQIISDMFVREKSEVWTTSTVAGALELCAANLPLPAGTDFSDEAVEIFLFDESLDVASELSVMCHKLRNDPVLRHVRFVYLTSGGTANELDVQPDAILVKPFTLSALNAALENLDEVMANFDARQDEEDHLARTNELPQPDARILVCDDMEVNRLILASMIDEAGYVVPATHTADGVEGLQAYKDAYQANKPFDIILLDVHMPRMSGYECCRAIRQFERDVSVTTPVPIVCLTAEGATKEHERALNIGFTSVLPKPFTSEGIAAMLKELLLPRPVLTMTRSGSKTGSRSETAGMGLRRLSSPRMSSNPLPPGRSPLEESESDLSHSSVVVANANTLNTSPAAALPSNLGLNSSTAAGVLSAPAASGLLDSNNNAAGSNAAVDIARTPSTPNAAFTPTKAQAPSPAVAAVVASAAKPATDMNSPLRANTAPSGFVTPKMAVTSPSNTTLAGTAATAGTAPMGSTVPPSPTGSTRSLVGGESTTNAPSSGLRPPRPGSPHSRPGAVGANAPPAAAMGLDFSSTQFTQTLSSSNSQTAIGAATNTSRDAPPTRRRFSEPDASTVTVAPEKDTTVVLSVENMLTGMMLAQVLGSLPKPPIVSLMSLDQMRALPAETTHTAIFIDGDGASADSLLAGAPLSSLGERVVALTAVPSRGEALRISATCQVLSVPYTAESVFAVLEVAAKCTAKDLAAAASADGEPRTRFRRKTSSRSSIEATANARDLARRGALRILAVDDNPINMMMLREFLREAGYTNVETACNGEEAANKFSAAELPFEMVLMDCLMPICDGYTATQRIREFEQNKARNRVPVIAVTANNNPQDKKRCMDAGMDDYLGKPYDATSLMKTLEPWAIPNSPPTRVRAVTAPSDKS